MGASAVAEKRTQALVAHVLPLSWLLQIRLAAIPGLAEFCKHSSPAKFARIADVLAQLLIAQGAVTRVASRRAAPSWR